MTNATGTHHFVPDPRNADVLIDVNGTHVPRPQASVSVFDSGFMLGDGVWEGLRVHQGRIAFLDRHLDRLYRGAKAIAMNIGLPREELEHRLYALLDANGMEGDGVHIRLMVTRGVRSTPYQDPRVVISPRERDHMGGIRRALRAFVGCTDMEGTMAASDTNVTRRSVMQLTGAALAMPVVNLDQSRSESGPMSFSPKFVDMVRNLASVAGTGPVTLGAAVEGYSSLADAVGTGEQFYYSLQSVDKPAEREVGRGTMQADGRVAREAIGGSPTSFGGGAKTIALVTPAEWFARLDQLAGSAVVTAASRAELASKEPGRALLAEGGRLGFFDFDDGDLSARVASDPRQGIHIAPAGDPTGRSGAWVRRIDGPVNVHWFGVASDGVTDDSPAFVAALALLKQIAGNSGGTSFTKASPELFIPAGAYFMGTTTLDITHAVSIRGEGSGFNGVAPATLLKWGPNATAIRIQAANTSGAGTVDGGIHFSGQGTRLQGFAVEGSFNGTEGEFHGVHAKAKFSAEDFVVNSFAGDGIHIHCTSGSGAADEGNANLFRIENAALLGCRDGLSTKGADANAGSCINVDCSFNRRWGVNESSFLGNSYIACHTAGNGSWAGAPSTVSFNGIRYAVRDGLEAAASTNAPSGTEADNAWWYYLGPGGPAAGFPAWSNGIACRSGGPYRTDNFNGRNVFHGCYSEGDQPPSQFVHPTVVASGLHGAGVKGTALYIRSYSGGNLQVDGVVVGETPKAAIGGDGSILCLSTGRVGYGSGAGGIATQAGGKNATVTINKSCGQIVTDNTSLASGETMSFLVNNSIVRATDGIDIWLVSGFAAPASYQMWIDGVSQGIFRITMKNISAGSLSEALTIGFAIKGAVTS